MNNTTFYFMPSLGRFLLGISFSWLMTCALFMLMSKLVSHDFEAPPEENPVATIDIWAEEDPYKIDERFEKVVKPEPQVEPPEVDFQEHFNEAEFDGVPPLVELDLKPTKAKLNFSNSTIPVAHLLRQPNYPSWAAMKGIEGWVEVLFDVDAQGATLNIQILDARPKGVFEKSAKSAIRKWRYQPRLDANGEPVGFRGLKKRIVFEMEGSI